jgi:hypothetical protein
MASVGSLVLVRPGASWMHRIACLRVCGLCGMCAAYLFLGRWLCSWSVCKCSAALVTQPHGVPEQTCAHDRAAHRVCCVHFAHCCDSFEVCASWQMLQRLCAAMQSAVPVFGWGLIILNACAGLLVCYADFWCGIACWCWYDNMTLRFSGVLCLHSSIRGPCTQHALPARQSSRFMGRPLGSLLWFVCCSRLFACWL